MAIRGEWLPSTPFRMHFTKSTIEFYVADVARLQTVTSKVQILANPSTKNP